MVTRVLRNAFCFRSDRDGVRLLFEVFFFLKRRDFRRHFRTSRFVAVHFFAFSSEDYFRYGHVFNRYVRACDAALMRSYFRFLWDFETYARFFYGFRDFLEVRAFHCFLRFLFREPKCTVPFQASTLIDLRCSATRVDVYFDLDQDLFDWYRRRNRRTLEDVAKFVSFVYFDGFVKDGTDGATGRFVEDRQ